MSNTLRVLIVGGGLGGLCLAQGLKQAGLDVAVYERDRTSSERLQGYRIHIDEHGNRALAACLPAPLFKHYVASSGDAGTGYRIASHHLEQIMFFGASKPAAHDAIPGSLSVSRITLRDVLLTGLGDVVHFGKSFVRYEESQDSVTAYFDDGSCATGDVLIGADGGNSRVRKQRLPHAQRLATGVTSIIGKAPLDQATKQVLLPGRLDGATSILGPQGRAMFVAIHELHQPATPQAEASNPPNGENTFLFDNTSDYVFWALLVRERELTHDLHQADGATLQTMVANIVDQWHPNVGQLVRISEPSTVIAKPLHTAHTVKSWTTSRVTLLGDAIHSMPPTRGSGGNTALRDAHVLCQQLVKVHEGDAQLLPAINHYERAMRRYGFGMVRSSMQTLNIHVAYSRRMFIAMMRALQTLGVLR